MGQGRSRLSDGFSKHGMKHMAGFNPSVRGQRNLRRSAFLSILAVPTAGVLWLTVPLIVLSTAEEHPKTIANPTTLTFLDALPTNAWSRSVGYIASYPYAPQWFQQFLIRCYVWAYHIPYPSSMEDPPLDAYKTLQDFFVRAPSPARLASISSSSNNNNTCEDGLMSPCDAQILRIGTISNDSGSMVQVKGCSYTFTNLFRQQLPASPNATDRYYFLFHLRPTDIHRFYSPSTFVVREAIHVPGQLFPVFHAFAKWYPQLYVTNERIVLNGHIERAVNSKSATGATTQVQDEQPPVIKSASSNWFLRVLGLGKGNQPVALKPNVTPVEEPVVGGEPVIPRCCSMALVGATSVGKIQLNFDERFSTNLPNAPSYSTPVRYDEKCPVLAPGAEVGKFLLGSAIILVADIPKNKSVLVKEGDVVRIGQPLFT